MRKAPSLNGGIAPDFLDKGSDFAFLCVRPALHHRQIVQAFLVGFLLLFPFLRRHNRFVAALDDLPILTGDNVISVGADAFLVCPADKMCAFIKGISQDMADPCAPP